MVKRKREALEYAIEQIESGRVKVRGVDPEGNPITAKRRVAELRDRLAGLGAPVR